MMKKIRWYTRTSCGQVSSWSICPFKRYRQKTGPREPETDSSTFANRWTYRWRRRHLKNSDGMGGSFRRPWCPSRSSRIYWELMRGSRAGREAAQLSATSQPLQPQLSVFPDMTAETELSDLIGERSYMLFDLLGLSCSCLMLPSAGWHECPDYIPTGQGIHGDCEDNERCSWRGSSCWRTSLSFWRRTSWNAHG